MGRYQMSPTAFRELCASKNLRVSRDEDNTVIAKGVNGHLFQYDDEHFGCVFLPTDRDDSERDFRWRQRAKRLPDGCRITQYGDREGIFVFRFDNDEALAYAVKMVRHRKKRVMTEEQLADLRARAAKYFR